MSIEDVLKVSATIIYSQCPLSAAGEIDYVNVIDICPLSVYNIQFLTPNGGIDECSLKEEFRVLKNFQMRYDLLLPYQTLTV